jgi:hypothetical protein
LKLKLENKLRKNFRKSKGTRKYEMIPTKLSPSKRTEDAQQLLRKELASKPRKSSRVNHGQ